jgi:RNA polymerase sigma factor (sigma-70 family)
MPFIPPSLDDPSQQSAAKTERVRTIESLSTRFRGPLRRFFAKRRIPPHDIDDLVQEVFIRMAVRRDVASVQRLEAYLFTVAANLLRDRHRYLSSQAMKGHEPYDEALHGGALQSQGPDRALLATQMVAQLVEALHELPERTRVIFTLYHLEDLSHREISQSLGIPVSTIEKHMSRATAHLVKRMQRL